MKKLIICLALISLVLISGCVKNKTLEERDSENQSKYRHAYVKTLWNGCEELTMCHGAYSICSDRIICFYMYTGQGSGLDCFRDEDLVKKYCGD